MTPEFSRPVALDVIGGAPHSIQIAATAAERAALAVRFGIPGLDRLEGDLRYWQDDAGYRVSGQVAGDATQICVATGQSIPARIQEKIVLRFVASAQAMGEGDEIEIAADDMDELNHDGRVIDLGEAVAQTFALALDPFPRSAGAEEFLRAAGVVDERDVGPFSALKSLLKKD